MTEYVSILVHGYLKYVEHKGSDERIIEAARMSVDGGFVSWEPYEGHPRGDAGLLRYLWKHEHTSPFESPALEVEVKCPIVVAWQWVRHRTMSYNVLSGRYAEMPNENYIPTLRRMRLHNGVNKQADTMKGAAELTDQVAAELLVEEIEFAAAAEKFYQKKLAAGVPKELARIHLGFSRYTRMRVSANLLNWLKFLKLRMAADTQWETRQYANAVGNLIAELFPRTWALFSEEATPQQKGETVRSGFSS